MTQSLKVKFEAIAVFISTLLIIAGFIIDQLYETSLLIIPILYGLAFLIGGFSKAKEGIEATIENKALNVEILMILAAIGAFIVGEYFEGAILIFIFAVSGVLESYATEQSEKSLTSLLKLAPKTANKLIGKEIVEVDVETIVIGDLIVVKVGEQVPVDGKIYQGKSSFDQQAITGESLPVNKYKDEDIVSGSINLEAQIIMIATKDAKQSLMQQMVDLVKEAQEQKSPSQSKIDRFEKIYVYVVIGLSLLFMISPYLFPFFNLTPEDAFYRGIIVLVVGSPCALVASISPAMLASLSNGAKEHILIKGGHYLEILQSIDYVVFDKTGTITTGEPTVQNMMVKKGISLHPLTSIITAMEKQSTHPLAKAITKHFSITSYIELETKEISGQGLEANYEGHHYQIGRFDSQLDDHLMNVAETLQAQGQSIVWIHQDGEQIAFISIQDSIRKESKPMIEALHDLGIQTMMLTGDHENTASHIAKQVGIDHYMADCYPKDKLDKIDALQTNYHVMMVGDGLNDAPALTKANLGIAMGTGTDVSLETADIIIMNDVLSSITHLFHLAKKMNTIITQNIIFAVSVISLLMISNVFGLIALPSGVIAHEGSTILVILNSLRLLNTKRNN
jgi:Zn2+/Cd2+-exporting ATPase